LRRTRAIDGEISKLGERREPISWSRNPGGFLLLSQKALREDFAQDLTPAEKARLARRNRRPPEPSSSQADRRGLACEACVVRRGSNDRMIDPEQEKSMATQIKAKATYLLPLPRAMSPVSHPRRRESHRRSRCNGLRR